MLRNYEYKKTKIKIMKKVDNPQEPKEIMFVIAFLQSEYDKFLLFVIFGNLIRYPT